MPTRAFVALALLGLLAGFIATDGMARADEAGSTYRLVMEGMT